jgi:hypothetical protein
MRAIKSFEDYKADFRRIAETGALYAFFLYSTGGGGSEISQFVQNRKVLFNELAANANTDIFFFDEAIASSPDKNPSAEIAGLFGISLAELPGILVFAEIRDDAVNDGVFFPLAKNDFVAQPDVAAAKMARIFDCLRDMQASTQDLQVRMQALQGEERRLAAAERWRKIRTGMGAALPDMKSLSSVLVDTLAKGLAAFAAKSVGL